MLASTLKKYRALMGFTQTELSHLSGVSLPTIQNIEAHKANPEYETVAKLLNALGLETRLVPRSADWDYLNKCGVPLLAIHNTHRTPNVKDFLQELRLALLECDATSEGRKKKAIGATLLALATHYPSIFKTLSRSKSTRLLMVGSDRIKLRRTVLNGLSRFL